MRNEIQQQFPFKLFYKIGEASKIVGVEPYVLRYWETEFSFLKPQKTKTGQRLYTRQDIEVLLLIKKMLYEERYTIEGVRKKLSENQQLSQKAQKEELIEKVKNKLREILNMLS